MTKLRLNSSDLTLLGLGGGLQDPDHAARPFRHPSGQNLLPFTKKILWSAFIYHELTEEVWSDFVEVNRGKLSVEYKK